MFGYKPLSATGDVTEDDVALDSPIGVDVDVENDDNDDDDDDVDGPEEVVLTMICVVDVGEGVVYMVAVLSVIVASTAGEGGGRGGDAFGGGGGSCPSRTAVNGGGTTLTVAHFSVNQAEVDWKSVELQSTEKQGTARTKNPWPGSHTQVHYSSALNKFWMV